MGDISWKLAEVNHRLDSTPYTPRVPSTNGKRKAAFETPINPKVNKSRNKGSPTDGRATPYDANGKNGFTNGQSQVYQISFSNIH